MILVLEIILTVTAWKKGWGWLALLPMLGALVMGGLFGYVLGINGVTSNESFLVTGLVIDGVTVIILIIMSIVGKTTNLPPNVEKENSEE